MPRLRKRCFRRLDYGFVARHADAKRGGDRLARQVVLGRSKPTGEEHNIGTTKRDLGGVCELCQRVAKDGLEGDLNAQPVQLGRQCEGVRVLPVGCQHLAADGDNFSDHLVS